MRHNRARMRQPTPLQQAASRSNGAKSLGPKTADGKRRSSRNGCKHNLYSRVAPMPPADDPEFLADLADYRAHYQPRTFEAESAVLSLAANMWLRMRLWPVCTEMWKAESLRQAALLPGEESRLHDAFALHHPSLQPFQRMEDRYNRRIARAFKTIQREEKLAIRAERLRLRAEKTAKMQRQTPPQPAPADTRDFSRVPPPQQETPAAPKNIKNEAPNLIAPVCTRMGTRDFSRVPPAQQKTPAAPKNNENEAPNLAPISPTNPSENDSLPSTGTLWVREGAIFRRQHQLHHNRRVHRVRVIPWRGANCPEPKALIERDHRLIAPAHVGRDAPEPVVPGVRNLPGLHEAPQSPAPELRQQAGRGNIK